MRAALLILAVASLSGCHLLRSVRLYEEHWRGLQVSRLHSTMESNGIRGMLTLYAADWFHPNDRGYQVWADAFLEELRQILP